jgi:hypothetical protein
MPLATGSQKLAQTEQALYMEARAGQSLGLQWLRPGRVGSSLESVLHVWAAFTQAWFPWW